MPAIEELADKENDTFAQGGPLAGLARQMSKERQKDRSNVRSASTSSKPSALVSNEKNREKYRMYREPGDDSSMGIGLLAAKQR